ncbi:hypothetical protein [Sporichthya polymorpha]|uniref:hypothetical protein n=1 Tax=Sporichthya polymorpha TaxID=35751 RepID=UPI00035F76D1|nr:hypothetical protein [Sporichthya polymorpha]
MNPELIFTEPPELVQEARIAMARAECRLTLQDGPPITRCDATYIGLAFLVLEAVDPPYPPLFDVEPSLDTRADITAAIWRLGEAIAEADSAADVLRYAATIADLRDLNLLTPDLDPDPEPGLGGWSGQWQ